MRVDELVVSLREQFEAIAANREEFSRLLDTAASHFRR